jgi:hypothetical protein
MKANQNAKKREKNFKNRYLTRKLLASLFIQKQKIQKYLTPQLLL